MSTIPGRKRVFRVAALLLVFGVGNAGAIVPVTDVAHITVSQTGWIKDLISQGEQYAKQIAQYRTQLLQYETQVQQYEQQYVKGGIFRQAAMSTHEFTERPLDAGLSERCPTGLRSLLADSHAADNCALIVRTENARYNALVAVLNKTKQRDQELQRIYAERAAISQQDAGALQANNNELLALQARMQTDIQQARSQTESFDHYLELLRDDQKMIADGALNGSGLANGIVRGAALQAALNAARRGDR